MTKKEPSYLKYWDINNLFKWTMSQRLLLCGFKWTGETCQINENFIKSYNDDNDEGYFLEVDVKYLENVRNLHNDLLERMKIEKTEILAVNFHDKEIYGTSITFNQKACLKPYIDINIELRKK